MAGVLCIRGRLRVAVAGAVVACGLGYRPALDDLGGARHYEHDRVRRGFWKSGNYEALLQ
jgi:hypothetical protein